MLKETLKCGFDPSYPFSCLTFSFFMSLFLFGHLYYGWLLLQTLTSEINPWTKISFILNFASWLFFTFGIIVTAILLLKERKRNVE